MALLGGKLDTKYQVGVGLAVIGIGAGLVALDELLGIILMIAGLAWLAIVAIESLPLRALTGAEKRIIVIWALFAVVCPVASPATAYVVRVTDFGGAHPVRNGDLYLLGSVLCFWAVGSIFQSPGKTFSRTVMGLTVGTAVVGIIDYGTYQVVASSIAAPSIWVESSSLVLYTGSALLNAGCRLVAEGGRSE